MRWNDRSLFECLYPFDVDVDVGVVRAALCGWSHTHVHSNSFCRGKLRRRNFSRTFSLKPLPSATPRTKRHLHHTSPPYPRSLTRQLAAWWRFCRFDCASLSVFLVEAIQLVSPRTLLCWLCMSQKHGCLSSLALLHGISLRRHQCCRFSRHIA